MKKKRGGLVEKILGIICICCELLRYYSIVAILFYRNSIVHYRSCAIKKCLKKIGRGVGGRACHSPAAVQL